MHIMLKSDYDMDFLVSMYYKSEIYKQISEAGGGKPSIVENYIMAGHAVVVVKDINLLFHQRNAVILTLW